VTARAPIEVVREIYPSEPANLADQATLERFHAR
jgi:hypothetical protein